MRYLPQLSQAGAVHAKATMVDQDRTVDAADIAAHTALVLVFCQDHLATASVGTETEFPIMQPGFRDDGAIC